MRTNFDKVIESPVTLAEAMITFKLAEQCKENKCKHSNCTDCITEWLNQKATYQYTKMEYVTAYDLNANGYTYIRRIKDGNTVGIYASKPGFNHKLKNQNLFQNINECVKISTILKELDNFILKKL